jgi:hypothetical protein
MEHDNQRRQRLSRAQRAWMCTQPHLDELRSRIAELSKQLDIWLVCGVGQRADYPARLLLQNGFDVKNLSGGMQTYETFAASRRETVPWIFAAPKP